MCSIVGTLCKEERVEIATTTTVRTKFTHNVYIFSAPIVCARLCTITHTTHQTDKSYLYLFSLLACVRCSTALSLTHSLFEMHTHSLVQAHARIQMRTQHSPFNAFFTNILV